MKVVPAGEMELRKWAVEQAGGDLDHAQEIYEFAAGMKAAQQVTIDLKFDTSAVERLMEDLKKSGVVEAASPRRLVIEEHQYEIYTGQALGAPYSAKPGVIRVPREDGQGYEFKAAFQYNVADGIDRWLLLDEVVGMLMNAGQPGTSGKLPPWPPTR